jgi:hypothetical protein
MDAKYFGHSQGKTSFLTKLVFVLSLSLLNIIPIATLTTPARAETSIGTTGSVTISSSDTYTVLNSSLSISDSISISGFIDNVRVTITTDTGTVQITTTAGLNTVLGYDNSSSVGIAGDEIAFEGSVSNAQVAMNSLRYIANNVTGNATISISVSFVGSGSVNFNPDNGHYYIMYNRTNTTWAWAYDSTTTGINFNGQSGYLATSTSDTETAFIKDKVGLNQAWLGGYETTTSGSGVWKWVPNAPTSEAGKVFFYDIDNFPGTGCLNGLGGAGVVGAAGNCSGGTGVAGETITAMHNNWNSGEPNDDSGGAGDALQVLAGGTGEWNDLTQNSATLNYYLVEFGGKGETPTYEARSRTVIVAYTKPAASISTASPTSCPLLSISSLSPSGGTSSGGTRLTINGQGLTSSVYINERIADVRIASSNSVTVLTPPGTRGSATLRIDGCGNSASSTYLYDPDPVISSLFTSSISTSGGSITITGTFLSGASITIGTNRATISSNTDSLITATLPASPAGEKVMTLTTAFGSTTSKLTYLDPPNLAATISSGYIAQGDAVNLSYATTGATSYSTSGLLPQGLSLNTTTGSLSGTATKEGIYRFSITANNVAGSDTKSYALDIDRPTPKALTANLYFAYKITSLTPSNKSGLDRLIAKVKSVAPRNLSATITIAGGAGNSKTALTTTRHEQIRRYLEASGIKVKSATSTIGNANKVGITITWIR